MSNRKKRKSSGNKVYSVGDVINILGLDKQYEVVGIEEKDGEVYYSIKLIETE